MSDLTDRLAADEIVRGVGVTTFSPALVEVVGSLGLDFTWLDLEHKGPSPADSHTLEHLARAAETVDTELLVRVPAAEPWLLQRVLDTGVNNLLVPRVETAADVREVARAMAYTDEQGTGDRGIGNSRASDWGTGGYEPWNGSPGLGVMIETATAVDEIDEILGVGGLDFVYLGPSDLAVTLGRPFETDHPAVRDAVDTVTEACLEQGVPLGRSVTDPDDIEAVLEDGWQLLRYGDEMDAVRRTVDAFEARLSASGKD